MSITIHSNRELNQNMKIADLLAMSSDAEIDLDAPRLTSLLFHAADFSEQFANIIVTTAPFSLFNVKTP